MHQTERPAGKEIRRRIEISRVFGAEMEGGRCEAVYGYVREGGAEDLRLDGGEGAGWGGVVGGVVGAVGEGRGEGGGG